MMISALKAAELLGVSRMQISRLAAAGEIKAARFGNALQLDLDSLHRYQDLRPNRGRPLQPVAAWEILLAHAQPQNLDELKSLAVAVRRRAQRREYRVLPAMADKLLADPNVVVSGASAAARQGAAVQDRAPWAIYVRQSNAQKIIKQHHLREADDHNLIMRVVPNNAWNFGHQKLAPMNVALVDLVDERDDRSASEALGR